jgi:hypothetical protein
MPKPTTVAQLWIDIGLSSNSHHIKALHTRNLISFMHMSCHVITAKCLPLTRPLSLDTISRIHLLPPAHIPSLLHPSTSPTQRQHQMQRRTPLKLIILRRLIVRPTSHISLVLSITPFKPANSFLRVQRTFVYRRKSSAAAPAECLLFLRRAPLSETPVCGVSI